MKYQFLTVGGATRDVSFFAPQGILVDNRQDLLRQKLLAFEYGSKIKVDRFRYAFGGGAANAAVCLSNFGFKTACLCSLGRDDNARLIRENLREHGIYDLSQQDGYDSGSSFILVSPSGERVIFGSRGANVDLKIGRSEAREIGRAENLYLASLSGAWQGKLKAIFEAVTEKGPKVFWNPGTSQLQAGLDRLCPYLAKTEVFSLNEDEAIELVMSSKKYKNSGAEFFRSYKNLLKAIKGCGAKVVVITRGEKGVCAYDGRKFYNEKILKEKKRVDTTGVGDVFNSSFAAGYVRYGDITKAMKLALRNTALKVAHLGAQEGLLKIKL